jgi:hypothetical protein
MTVASEFISKQTSAEEMLQSCSGINMVPVLTGIHSHFMQYITPKGGPRSANHVDPISCSDFPNWHSATEEKTRHA